MGYRINLSLLPNGILYDCTLQVCAGNCIGRLIGNTQVNLRDILECKWGTLNTGDSHKAPPLWKRGCGIGDAAIQICSWKLVWNPIHQDRKCRVIRPIDSTCRRCRERSQINSKSRFGAQQCEEHKKNMLMSKFQWEQIVQINLEVLHEQ